LLKQGARLKERDLGKDPLTEAELRALFGARDPRDFLNPRNDLYRRMKMKDHPPSAAETIRLMAREPNLIRRPLVARGHTLVAGYDERTLLDLIR
jgi:arsenate reductase-like glutaredoxin family protein